VGYEVVDDVASEVMIRVGSDYQRPEDYLDSFARFVKENPEHIQAIQILLERPKEWRTSTLNELRNQLELNKYSEEYLRKAFQVTHHKALADIISMVKHAAKEEEPLLTAEERVDQALRKVTAGKSFNEEQLKWLGMIRLHLIEHLTIDLSDFEAIPIFERAGGKKKAEKVFGEELTDLIVELNTNIAA
jgi:type I restriction enzyme R subunit